MFFKRLVPGVYGIQPGSREEADALEDIRIEVLALLSPVCRHPDIVQLIGVVVDDKGRPAQLLFERASLGDLQR